MAGFLKRTKPRTAQAAAKRFVGDRRGLTLLELTVVGAVLGIMSALIAVGVTGRATDSKAAVRTSDQAEVQKAVDTYSGEHPVGHYPTLDGCLPGQNFNSVQLVCQSGANPGDFNVNNPATYKAIIWDKAFKVTLPSGQSTTKTFIPVHLAREPKHAFEHTDESAWPTNLVSDPEGVVAQGLRIPDPLKTPVWVIDRKGKVHVTLPEGKY
jgi:type II secretory pathway pseudopilin PulG